ncbi:hypothetical protein EPI10_007123 [Gossypium australe]|uniref:Tf2-1-like SH3-like domain-containing protein n=1 Tax=Gossypium australe TaxID=47621 RepID=A0A5B6WT73_9ROSI|nr:hypothetical protein EPI10_007123 [Gossypium australe]
MVESEGKIRLIQNRLKVASDRQKSYTDLKRKDIKYNVRDQVFLKMLCFSRKVGRVAYQLELPPELDRIYDVFHVSMLRRYRFNVFHIVLIEEIDVRPDLSFEEEPIQILRRK